MDTKVTLDVRDLMSLLTSVNANQSPLEIKVDNLAAEHALQDAIILQVSRQKTSDEKIPATTEIANNLMSEDSSAISAAFQEANATMQRILLQMEENHTAMRDALRDLQTCNSLLKSSEELRHVNGSSRR